MVASAIAMNKVFFKNIVINATKLSRDPIYFPETLEIKNKGKYLEVDYEDAFVVKPIKGGSSVGIKIIRKGEKIRKTDLLNKQYVMAEMFVGSIELTVTVLKDNPLCVLIGPEGDFSEKERKEILNLKNTKSIKINKNILRSETAAISIISIISFKILSQ